MAHRRPPLMRALQLNTAVLVVEIAAGIGANSFSLIMDGVHNLSDEVALLLLVFAYTFRAGLSGQAAALCEPVQFGGTSGRLRFPCLARCRASVSPGRSLRSCPDRCGLDRSCR